MRSIATRRQHLATSEMLADQVQFLKSLDFDLIIVETAGIGQSDSEIVDLVDFSVYVMTSDYGAASQLEKIDMLDFADLIVLEQVRQARRRGRAARYPQAVEAQSRAVPGPPMRTCRSIRRSRASSTIRASTGCSPNCAGAWSPSSDSKTTPGPGIDVSEKGREPRATALIPGAAFVTWPRSRSRAGGSMPTSSRQAEAGQQAAACTRRTPSEDPELPGRLEAFGPPLALTNKDRSIARAAPALPGNATGNLD